MTTKTTTPTATNDSRISKYFVSKKGNPGLAGVFFAYRSILANRGK
jgi:hypothetical protein